MRHDCGCDGLRDCILQSARPRASDALPSISVRWGWPARFTLSRSGQVTSSRLGGSSGVAAFDAQAMAMIRQASPFPPFPDEIKTGSMSFTIPVEFTVR
ncbi:energy transducer TonB family protein [Bradyrhizobium sp. PUT101]|uniref:energy transducer TonB family protein n=1 Tax=Bradyrhizobium sp. PUT101 TaxID=3447427 RepID=UPI003F84AA39